MKRQIHLRVSFDISNEKEFRRACEERCKQQGLDIDDKDEDELAAILLEPLQSECPPGLRVQYGTTLIEIEDNEE